MWHNGSNFEMVNLDFIYEIPSGGSLWLEDEHYILNEERFLHTLGALSHD